MQTPIPPTAVKCNQKPLRLTKRIAPTTYKIIVHFSKTSKQTMGDKIIHLIENDVPLTPFAARKREP